MLQKAFRRALRICIAIWAPALRVTRAETWLTVYRSLDTGAVAASSKNPGSARIDGKRQKMLRVKTF